MCVVKCVCLFLLASEFGIFKSKADTWNYLGIGRAQMSPKRQPWCPHRQGSAFFGPRWGRLGPRPWVWLCPLGRCGERGCCLPGLSRGTKSLCRPPPPPPNQQTDLIFVCFSGISRMGQQLDALSAAVCCLRQSIFHNNNRGRGKMLPLF